MNDKPLVSVIIPAYKASRYVREAVDSALAQTYPNVEVVVVDDGSPEDERAPLADLIEQKKIVYIRQENKGLAGARNTAIRNSHGEFIAILDADDAFLPNKMERQISYLLAHPQCDICYCDVSHYYEEEPEKMLRLNYEYPTGDAVFPALLYKNFINPLTTVIRRSVFDRVGYFDEEIRQLVEDWEFWVRAARAGMRIEHLPETLARYRMRRNSLSYDPTPEVRRKRLVLGIFKRLNASMTPEERRHYGMANVIRHHRVRVWYAELAQRFSILSRLHQWIQRQRLKDR